jgi:hypothetical protein
MDSKKLFEKKIYLDLTGGSQTTPLQKSLILGVGEGLLTIDNLRGQL